MRQQEFDEDALLQVRERVMQSEIREGRLAPAFEVLTALLDNFVRVIDLQGQAREGTLAWAEAVEQAKEELSTARSNGQAVLRNIEQLCPNLQ